LEHSVQLTGAKDQHDKHILARARVLFASYHQHVVAMVGWDCGLVKVHLTLLSSFSQLTHHKYQLVAGSSSAVLSFDPF